VEGSNRITPDALGHKLAEAIAALAEMAVKEADAGSGRARDLAEAAERLINALSVAAAMRG